MGEAKRRKAQGRIDDFAHHDRWTPETGARLAALCGGDVRRGEVCILGWIIASGAVAAADHDGLIHILENAPRVGTAREHWPKLTEAAGIAAMDLTFRAFGAPMYEELRSLAVRLAQ
jgi:hypothetical protein